jgi:hypothetical protein
LGGALFVFAGVTVVKIVNYGSSVCGDVAAYVGSVLADVCMSHSPCSLFSVECGAVRGLPGVFSVFRQALREVTVCLLRYVHLIKCSRKPFELTDLTSRGIFHIEKLIVPQLAKIFHEN